MAKLNFKYTPPADLPGVSPAVNVPAVSTPAAGPRTERFWHQSSWDLLRGLEVEDARDDIPSQLFNELFGDPHA